MKRIEYSEKSHTAFVVLISVIATIGGFLFGFDSGVINGTVQGLQEAFHAGALSTGFDVASMLLGCAAGAFFAGALADRFGRKSILLVAAVFFTVSAWGSGVADSSGSFIFYRLIGGLAVGAASILAPAYISEVAPARFRGALSSMQQIAIMSGIFVAFLSNYLIAGSAKGSTAKYWGGYEAWRWMFWVEIVPAVTFFFALLFIPESPRFLVATRQTDKALTVLQRLMGSGAAAKLAEIEGSLAQDHHRPRLSDALHARYGLRPIVWLGIGLASFQQLVGINVVMYYGAVLWQSAGFSESDALLMNVMTGGAGIGAAIVAMRLIDRVGRKPLLLIGSVGMALTLGTLTVVFAVAGTSANGQLSLTGASAPLALGAALAYGFLFNLSWGPVMWVMLGEMFPNQIRGSGLAISGLAQWGSNFTITLSFPILLAGVGLGPAYSLYTLFALVSAVFVVKLVRETKGKELELMEG